MKYFFIVGSPFCGSTAVGNILNTSSQIFHAGEVDRLDLFGQYTGENANLTVHGCALCGLGHQGGSCPVWHDFPSRPSSPAEKVRLYEEMVARAGRPVVLDSSKNADWMTMLWAAGLPVGGAIVLSRNPFAFARSHFKATGAPVWQGVEIWRNIYNHCLRAILHRGIPFMALRHEEIYTNTEGYFSRMLNFMGVTGGVDYAEFFRYPCHSLGGNWGAYVHYAGFDAAAFLHREAAEGRYADPQEMVVKLGRPASPKQRDDDGWMDHITAEEISAGISIPGVVDVMSLLGYDASAIAIRKAARDRRAEAA